METVLRQLQITCRVLLLAILVIVPLLVDHHIGSLGPESKFRFLEMGVLWVLLLSIPAFLFRQSNIKINLIHITLFISIAYILARAWFDPFQSHAFDYAFQLCSWMIFVLLVSSVCSTPKEFRRFLWIAIPAQLAAIVYAFGQIYRVDLYFKYILDRPKWVWQSPNIDPERALIFAPLGQPNYYANYGAIVFLFLCILLLIAKKYSQRFFIISMIGFLFYTLLYTFTRGIWVSVFSAIALVITLELVMQLCKNPDARSAITHVFKPMLYAAVIALFAFLTFAAYEYHQGDGPLHKIGKRFYHGISFRDTSMRTRPLLWYSTLRMWKQSPLTGQGIGQYAPQYLDNVFHITQEFDKFTINQITREMNTLRSDYSHNDYLQTLAEQGVIGLSLLLLLFLSSTSLALYVLWHSSLSPPDRITLLGCLTIVIQTMLQSVYDFSLRLPASALFFGLALSGILVYTRAYTSVTFSIKIPTVFRWGLSIFLILVGYLIGSIILNHFKASHLRNAGVFYIQEKYLALKDIHPAQALRDLETAEELLLHAKRLFPDQGEILHNLGRVNYFLYNYNPTMYFPRLKRARDYYEQAQFTFNDPEIIRMLCTVYLEEKRYNAAALPADRLLAIDPNREEAQYFSGLIDFHAGKFTEAVQHFQSEIKSNENHAFSYIYLARALEELQQYTAAAHTFENFLKIFPHWVDPRIRLGDLYANELHEPLKARGQYQTALDLSQKLQGSQRLSAIQSLTERLQTIEDKIQHEIESSDKHAAGE